jgi:hypothetical protein
MRYHAPVSVPSSAARLARLYVLRREQSDAGLCLDGYERWGHGSRYDEKERHIALVAQIPATEAEIEELTERLREREPDALGYFVDAQVRLLRHYLDAIADKEEASTERFVARRELDAWEELRRGELSRVEQNVYFVKLDVKLFIELFGFDPNTVT